MNGAGEFFFSLAKGGKKREKMRIFSKFKMHFTHVQLFCKHLFLTFLSIDDFLAKK